MISPASFLNVNTSHNGGNLDYTSSLTSLTYLSLSIPPAAPPPDALNYNKLSQILFALLVKYVISAFGCKPNTIGELINGR